jgi:hypothetical protein
MVVVEDVVIVVVVEVAGHAHSSLQVAPLPQRAGQSLPRALQHA